VNALVEEQGRRKPASLAAIHHSPRIGAAPAPACVGQGDAGVFALGRVALKLSWPTR